MPVPLSGIGVDTGDQTSPTKGSNPLYDRKRVNICECLKTRLCFLEFLHFINQYDILCFVKIKPDDIDKIDTQVILYIQTTEI